MLLLVGGLILVPVGRSTQAHAQVQPPINQTLWIYRVPEKVTLWEVFTFWIQTEVWVDASVGTVPTEEEWEALQIDRIWLNLTLSGGLKWDWQSATPSLVFWLPLSYTHNGPRTPSLEVQATQTGFHTITIESYLGEFPAQHEQVGLWVTPYRYGSFVSRFLQHWGWVGLGVFLGLGIAGLVVLGYHVNRYLGRKAQEAEK